MLNDCMTQNTNQRTLLFTEAEWRAAMPTVVKDMTDFLSARRAPVFKDHGTHGEGWGSGSYLLLGGKVYILTNEHVADARTPSQDLASQLRGQDAIWRIVGDHIQLPLPLDLALLPVPDSMWTTTHGSVAIGIEQIAIAHDPLEGELLAFTGFAGERVHFHFGTLFSEAICSTAREIPLPEDGRFSCRFHFGLDYRPNLAEDVIGTNGLPLPPGLSGSTVWNTRFVAAKVAGQRWSPDLAQVTGVVWGWPTDLGCVVATRAEYVRSFLLEAARKLGIGV
jgi:hypothetical protein